MTNARWSVVLTLVLVSLSAVHGQPKGDRVTVTGEVVEMWCYLEAGDRGAAKKACATAGVQMLYIESVR